MNIADKYNEKKRIEQENAEAARKVRLQNLVNKITSTLDDEETIEAIENYLIEHGAVSISDFGCLCQGGFCTWQKGLTGMLRPLIEEWKEKGVRVILSLSLSFQVKIGSISSDHKMTIEELKKWNKSKK